MTVTPTYHVFEMYKVHHGGTLLPTENGPADYTIGDATIPSVHVSASRDKDGRIHMSLVNARPDVPAPVTVKVAGAMPADVSGRILSADAMDAHNTFDRPNAVQPTTLEGATVRGDVIELTLPAKSVAVLALDGENLRR
jgi:alpha-N-arabinofuranosidase